MAQLMPPDAYINLRSQVANLFKLMFSRKPWGRLSIEGKPNFRSERITKAEWILQNNLDMQHEGAGYELSAIETLYQTLVAGIGCTFTRWVNRTEPVPIRGADKQLIVKDGVLQVEQKSVAEYAQTDHIDVRRMRFDPMVMNLRNKRIAGFQSQIPFSQLLVMKKLSQGYINFDEDELWRSSFDRDLYYQYIDAETNNYPDRGGDNMDFGDKPVERHHIRGMFRIPKAKGDGAPDFRDLVVDIANRQVLIGLKHNDLPIHGWDCFDTAYIHPEASKAFRQGLLEPMLDELMELFIKRNQSLDEGSRSSHKMYMADSTAAQELPDYVPYERNRILKLDVSASGLADIRQALAEMPNTASAQEVFIQAQELSQELQKGMFTPDYLGGFDPERKDTATGVSALVSGGTSVLELSLYLLKISMFSPNWRKTLILHNFFKGNKAETIYDIQGKPYEVLPGDLDFFYKVDIDVAAAIEQQSMVRRFVESYPTMINDPYYDQYEIRRTLVEVLQLPNAETILKPPEHLSEIVERENIALLNSSRLMALGDQDAGTIFVSQFDPHSLHIEGHVKARDLALQAGYPTKPFDDHIAEHQAFQEAQEDSQKGLGNTKEHGGNAGQNINAEQAANKSVPAAGGQRRRVA